MPTRRTPRKRQTAGTRRPRRRTGGTLRRHRRALARRIRRAVRRRLRATAKHVTTRLARHRARRADRRREAERARAAAGPLAVRSITGTPRAARGATAPTTAGRPAPPMKQRVKRTKDGKFNGSTGGGKKTTAKKTTAKKTVVTPEARKAAQTAKTLTAGNNRVARIDKRTDATDTRLDREFGH